MEKILISENLKNQEKAIKDAITFCQKMNAVLPEFQKETGYLLSLNEVRELLYQNDLTPLICSVKKSMEKSISGFNQLTQRTLKAGIDEFVYGIHEKMKHFTDSQFNPGIDYLNFLSLNNGMLSLPKEKEEEIRESFRRYLSGENTKEFYDTHMAVTKSLNDFSLFVKENSIIHPLFIESLAATFFSLDNQTGIVSSTSIDYARALKNNSCGNQ